MKVLKRLGLLVVFCASLVLLTGCGKEEEKVKNVEGSLEEIITKLYQNVADDQKPMGLMNIEVNEENIEGFLGTADIEYKEVLASESAVGSIAHSVVLVRTKENADVEAIKTKIKENVNPRKWICVGVEPEDVIIKSKGDLIIVIIVEAQETREKIDTEFDNL